MRITIKVLCTFLCALVISSCSFGYQRYVRVSVKIGDNIVLFSTVEEIAKRVGMTLLKKDADTNGTSVLAYNIISEVEERKIGISVLRENSKDGRESHWVSCGVYGRKPIEETVKNQVDDYFEMILSAMKSLEEDGSLKIEEIN